MEEKDKEKDESKENEEAPLIIADPKLEKTIEEGANPKNKTTNNIEGEDLDAK